MNQLSETDPLSVASLFIHSLEQESVDTVFGSMFHSLFFNERKKINYIQLTHEQSVIHAADGYARATGKPGVAFITTEYGLTNAITGIATAQIDSIPLVVFIQKDSNKNRQLDVESITKSISKYHYTIRKSADIHTITAQAIKNSLLNRPGVIIIEFDESVLLRKSEQPVVYKLLSSLERNHTKLSLKHLEKIIAAIKCAKKPVLIIGGGVIAGNASNELLYFIKKTKIPFTSTLMGLGAVNVKHPLHLGMLGMHGTFAANRAVHRADLLICLGVRFSDRITGKTRGFSPKSLKIHVEIDPSEVNKNIPVDYPVIGDVKDFLLKINPEFDQYRPHHWYNEVIKWRKISPQFNQSKSKLGPERIIKLLHTHAEKNVIIATDVGQHQMWTALHFPFDKPRKLLTSGGFGTMGFGLPAAIGGAISHPGQSVICVTGDGSIQMQIQELFHVAKYNLNIKIVILRNGYLGMVRQWQQLFYNNKYSQVKITSPDFVSFANSLGVRAFQASSESDADIFIKKAFQYDGPVLLDFLIEEEGNVFPIVPPGGNNTDALQEDPSNT
ncbi:acetolactate synthase, large subunit [Gracilibacillus ureilyticus]|uniref:Acetolactate synthase n=1 Tax=Gracilibacillus ureilyticus TaxID=531814 RepID=A0A1H9PVV3_9BACI|nr:biosynthetic-type acetolactate synthase large subunit [Gracilibacillus ureilyticus]SER52347.1 acetolactate synthase, large subunit [Gracilibacillus ureilyticus]